MNPRRLYRSRSDRAIAGIAGGMAEYLEVDVTVVRILWVVAGIFSGGLALLLYVILAFVIPLNPFPPYTPGGPGAYPAAPSGGWGQPGAPGSGGSANAQAWTASGSPQGGQAGHPGPSAYAAGGSPTWSPDWNAQWTAQRSARDQRQGRGGLIIGTVLIVFGVIALADVVVPGWISGALFGPAVLLAIGAVVLVLSLRRNETRERAGAVASSIIGGSSGAVEAPGFESGPATSYAVDAPSVSDDAPPPPAAPMATTGSYVSDITTTVTPPESDPA